MASTWIKRAQTRTLPPDAHGARAYAGRAEAEEERRAQSAEERASLRVSADGGTIRTIADLRALWARHGDAS